MKPREESWADERRRSPRGAAFLYALTNVGPGLLRAPPSEPWGRGRPLHIDAGAEINEYIGDIARTGSIGAPPAMALDLFAACLEAQERVRSRVSAGLSCATSGGLALTPSPQAGGDPTGAS